MKITLIRHLDLSNINTRVPESLVKIMGYTPPLGIAYLAAVLEMNGFDVDIIDSQALNMTKETLRKALLERKPDIVGITAMTPTIFGAFEAAEIAKESGATVVIGGPHMSACPVETVTNSNIDFGIIGEAEYSLLELVKALEAKTDISGIKGLVYKKDGKVVVNEPLIVENVDDLPMPARHLLNMDKYSSVIALHPMTTILVGRGCPFQCNFCFKQPSDKKIRIRSFRKVVDEIEFCVNNYNVREVMIIDDTFTIKRDYVSDFCNELIKRNLNVKWEATTRIDVIDRELLALMKTSGCIRLRYGIESGDERILQIMKKKIDLSKAVDVFKWTEEAGIAAFAYFILGYYSETRETMERSIALSLQLKADMVMFLKAVPMPGTGLFDIAVEKGFADRNYWGDYTLCKKLEPIKPFVPDADEYVRKAYHLFYLRPSYILKQLFTINSIDKLKKYALAAIGLIFFKMKK